MAVLAIAAVGAVAGGVVGAGFGAVALGASIGWMAGSFLGNLFFGPSPPTQEGPRLTDLNVQSSAEGVGIPIVFGRARIAGNVIWAQPIKETRHEEEVGGKGMGGGGTQVSYTYSVSFAIGLCEGPIAGIRKIWADSKLIYDIGSGTDAASLIVSSELAKSILIYTGSETQTADPMIQSFEGAANTPAYRGLAYVVFEDLQLADLANHLPNITVEVLAEGTNSLVAEEWGLIPVYPSANMATWNRFCANGQPEDASVLAACGDWDNSYASVKVDVYRCVLGGGRYKLYSFTSASNQPFSFGQSDEPCFVNLLSTSPYTYQYVAFNESAALPNSEIITNDNLGYQQSCFAKFGNEIVLGSYSFGSKTIYLYSLGRPRATLRVSRQLSTYVNALAMDANYVYAATMAASPELLVLSRSDLSTVATYSLIGLGSGQTGTTKIYSDGGGSVYLWNGPSQKVWKLRGGTLSEVFANSAPFVAVGACTSFSFNGSIGVFYNCGLYSAPNYLTAIRMVSRRLAASTKALSAVVSALCTRTGLSAADLDVSALTDTVDGYVIPRPMTARAALEQLRQAYFFDGVESDGKVKFVKRGGASQATIADDELGVREYGTEAAEPIRISRAQELELPVEVHVQYLDVDNDYLPGSQEARRLTTQSKNQIRVDLPLALSSAKAAQVADVLMRNAWIERHRFAFALTRKYAKLDPSDNITVPTAQGLALVRLTRTDYGASGVLACEALADDTVLYSSSVSGNDPGVNKPQTLSLAGPTTAVLLDGPILRDADDNPGFYIAASGYLGGWKGVALYKSVDDGATWDAALSLFTAASIGYTSNALGNFTGGNVWDKANTLNVKLTTPAATLSSTTELALYAGANACALGAHGRWEIVQFQTATLEADGSYTLSNLLRGRRGTEWAQGTHLAGDVFVLLSSATLRRVESGSSEIGLARLYRAVSIGASLESTGANSFTNTAVGLECYAPVNLGGGRNAASDVIITWQRRTRIGGEWRNYVDAALGETAESYEAEIWSTNFATLKRTITALTVKTTTYTSAQQVTDFGSNQASVGVKVYQLSATVGRGYAGQGIV